MTGPRRLSCTLHAPRETVFRAWTEARHIKAWFAPEGFTVPEATIEPHEGGRFDLCMASPAGERHWIRGRFEQIEPNQRLVVAMRITDVSGKPLFDAHTTATFADTPGGTQLDIGQDYTLIDPNAGWMVKGAPRGWASTLDRLGTELSPIRDANR